MRRVLASLLAAGLIASIAIAPVAARVRPSLTITFCSFASGSLAGYGLYTIAWANQAPSTTTDLVMNITFKGGKLVETLPTGTFTAPVPDNVFTNGLIGPFSGTPDWNAFASVTVKFTGAFRDSATVRQPAGGWAGPVPGQTTANCT